MNVFFSATPLPSFINAAWKDDGTYNEETWPSDAVLMTDDEISKYWKKSPPIGQCLGSNNLGRPCWVDIKKPELTYHEELADLNRAYSSERLSLCSAWLVAAVADGINEVARKADVEAELSDLDAKNAADVEALKKKYGVKQ